MPQSTTVPEVCAVATLSLLPSAEVIFILSVKATIKYLIKQLILYTYIQESEYKMWCTPDVILLAGPLKTTGNITLSLSRNKQSSKSYFSMQMRTGFESCTAILKEGIQIAFKLRSHAISSVSTTNASILHGLTRYCKENERISLRIVPLVKAKPETRYATRRR